MNQRDKAREIVNREFEVTITTQRSKAEVIAAVKQAAADSKRGFGAGVKHEGDLGGSDDLTTTKFSIRGPGGLLSLMDFTVESREVDGQRTVKIHVGDFIFEKGALGMKPRINAQSTMNIFLKKLQTAL